MQANISTGSKMGNLCCGSDGGEAPPPSPPETTTATAVTKETSKETSVSNDHLGVLNDIPQDDSIVEKVVGKITDFPEGG